MQPADFNRAGIGSRRRCPRTLWPGRVLDGSGPLAPARRNSPLRHGGRNGTDRRPDISFLRRLRTLTSSRTVRTGRAPLPDGRLRKRTVSGRTGRPKNSDRSGRIGLSDGSPRTIRCGNGCRIRQGRFSQGKRQQQRNAGQQIDQKGIVPVDRRQPAGQRRGQHERHVADRRADPELPDARRPEK